MCADNLMAKHGVSYKNLQKMAETYIQYGNKLFKLTRDWILGSSTLNCFLLQKTFIDTTKIKELSQRNFHMIVIGKLWSFEVKIDGQFFS